MPTKYGMKQAKRAIAESAECRRLQRQLARANGLIWDAVKAHGQTLLLLDAARADAAEARQLADRLAADCHEVAEALQNSQRRTAQLLAALKGQGLPPEDHGSHVRDWYRYHRPAGPPKNLPEPDCTLAAGYGGPPDPVADGSDWRSGG